MSLNIFKNLDHCFFIYCPSCCVPISRTAPNGNWKCFHSGGTSPQVGRSHFLLARVLAVDHSLRWRPMKTRRQVQLFSFIYHWSCCYGPWFLRTDLRDMSASPDDATLHRVEEWRGADMEATFSAGKKQWRWSMTKTYTLFTTNFLGQHPT